MIKFLKNKSHTFLQGIQSRRKDFKNTSSRQQVGRFLGKVRDKSANKSAVFFIIFIIFLGGLFFYPFQKAKAVVPVFDSAVQSEIEILNQVTAQIREDIHAMREKDVGIDAATGITSLINSFMPDGGILSGLGLTQSSFISSLGEIPFLSSLSESTGIGGALGDIFGRGGGRGGRLPTITPPGGWDGIFWQIAKGVLRTMVDDMINWIKYGDTGDGGPRFIQNFEDFLSKQADNAAGLFLRDILGAQNANKLCQPFRIQVGRLFDSRYRSFLDRAQCTPTKIMANIENTINNPEDIVQLNQFYDFKVTGWGGFLTAALDDFANPIGTYLTTQDELSRRIAQAQNAAKLESQSNQGFLGKRICIIPGAADGECFKWQTLSPGTIIADVLKENINSPIAALVSADELSEILTALIDAVGYRLWYRNGLVDRDNASNAGFSFGGAGGGTRNINAPPDVSLINKALFVSQCIQSQTNPNNCLTELTEGEEYQVRITMQNAGEKNWTTGQYMLGSRRPNNTTRWDPDGARIINGNRVALPNIVRAGEQITFNFAIIAPASRTETYNFQWGMVISGTDWFDNPTTNLEIRVRRGHNAEVVNYGVPFVVEKGKSFPVTITMKNTGTRAWNTTNRVLRKINPNDNTTWINGKNVSLPQNVQPGNEVTFSFTATAPNQAGTYPFQWQMRRTGEGAANFGQIAPTDSFTIEVVNPPPVLTASCYAVPSQINPGEPTTFVALPMGGSGNYTISWSGVVNGTGPLITFSSETPGDYSASVAINDGNASASGNCAVNVRSITPPAP